MFRATVADLPVLALEVLAEAKIPSHSCGSGPGAAKPASG
jgi:hypothetical protein